MKVFAFDRDYTVSTSYGPVSLELVKKLSENHIVYATGNQKLREEANIPGIGLWDEGPKPNRLRKIKELVPSCDEYIVVDDDDLSDVDGWKYFTPQEFMEKFDGLK